MDHFVQLIAFYFVIWRGTGGVGAKQQAVAGIVQLVGERALRVTGERSQNEEARGPRSRDFMVMCYRLTWATGQEQRQRPFAHSQSGGMMQRGPLCM